MRQTPSLRTIITVFLSLATFVAGGCGNQAGSGSSAGAPASTGAAEKGDNSPPKRYPMRGEVLRLDPSLHIAVIRGEKIEGWMEAMTMEYPIRDLQEFQKLQAGEKIQATVFVKGDDYWVGEIQEASAAQPAAAPAPR